MVTVYRPGRRTANRTEPVIVHTAPTMQLVVPFSVNPGLETLTAIPTSLAESLNRQRYSARQHRHRSRLCGSGRSLRLSGRVSVVATQGVFPLVSLHSSPPLDPSALPGDRGYWYYNHSYNINKRIHQD